MAKLNTDLLEQNPRLFRSHESKVSQFLRSKNIPARIDISNYENTQLYSQVKTVQTYDCVSAKDHKRFAKFCRMWLRDSGKLNKKYLTLTEKSVSYYNVKQHNLQQNKLQRERRLARKQLLSTD